MYEKTKKEIYNLIKLNTESIDWKTPEIVTTGEISRQLNIFNIVPWQAIC